MDKQGRKKVRKRLAAAREGPSKSRAKETPEVDATLKADVQAFASQLGLAVSAGNASGFDDRDFRPEAASRKLGSGKKSPAQAPRNSSNLPAAASARSASNARPSGATQRAPVRSSLPQGPDKSADQPQAGSGKLQGQQAAAPSNDRRARGATAQQRPQPGARHQAPSEAPGPGRNWNAGVGPRPGVLLIYSQNKLCQ